MILRLSNISYTFPTQDEALISSLNLEVKRGQFVSLIGKSGTGKSTIFKLIVGLIQQSEGDIMLNERAVSLGDVGYMPQRDLLLPWRTILDNIMLGGELQKDLKLKKEDARIWLERVGLATYEKAYPHQLSGGMRQRVSFLRALLMDKEVLLLDEPFGALDTLTKRELQIWLLSVWQELDKTILFITHDLEEACLLSDRTILLHPNGQLEDVDVTLPRPRCHDQRYTKDFITLRQELERKVENT